MSKIGYKVCSYKEGKFFSGFPFLAKKLRYKINKWTRPKRKDGPIAVFDILNNAVFFVGSQYKRYSNKIIFKCKYKPSKNNYLWCYKGKRRHIMDNQFPPGTVFADKVKILEVID